MESIFAPITGYGGSVFTIRISGKNILLPFLEKFLIKKNLQNIEAQKAYIFKLYDNECLLDEVLFLYFKAPKSFTGEDVIEISLHASRYIITRTLEMLSQIDNFRFAQRGEFTKRAMLNNKIDLLQSQGIDSMVRSESKFQHKLSSKMLAGDISKYYNQIKTNLLNILSQIEVVIDFPEDDIPDILNVQIHNLIKELKSLILTSISNHQKVKKIFNGFNIILFGEPNVGKSSLINFLSERNVSIVSNIAGTTRDIVSSELCINGNKVNIFDTAGLKFNNIDDKIEKIGIKNAKKLISHADLNICIIDASKNILHNIDFLKQKSIKNSNIDIILLNKADKVKNINSYKVKFQKEILRIRARKKNIEIIEISVKSKQNMDYLYKTLGDFIEKKMMFSTDGMLYFGDHDESNLKKAIYKLDNIKLNQSIELVAEDLRYLVRIFNEITGSITNEDILDIIFSKFCLGK